METIKAYYQTYKATIQMVIIIIVMVLLAYGAYRLYKYIRNKIALMNDASQNLGVNRQNLTYPENRYEIMAGSLEVAMRGPGTDEAAVMEVFNQMETGDDLKMLVQKFGIRTKGTWPATNEWNLTQWLTDEFSQSELAPLKDIFIQYNIPF